MLICFNENADLFRYLISTTIIICISESCKLIIVCISELAQSNQLNIKEESECLAYST